MTALLDVRDLSVHFPVRDAQGRRAVLHAVDGVSLQISPGRTLGLVGESGCGKTSLIRAILGLSPTCSGTVLLDGEDILAAGRASRRAASHRIQIVFQDPYGALNPTMTVAQIVSEPLRIHRRPVNAARVTQLLEQVGLDADAARRRPGEFSGGQRQRIGIARALALDPEVLILDEPVSALDVSVQAQVINLLVGLQHDTGLSFLFVAHDLSVVRHMSHDIAVMYLGRIIETGPRTAVFDAPAHPYTQALIDAAPRARYAGAPTTRRQALGEVPDPIDRPSGCAFRTRCPRAQPRCARDVPPLQAYGTDGQAAACWYPGS